MWILVADRKVERVAEPRGEKQYPAQLDFIAVVNASRSFKSPKVDVMPLARSMASYIGCVASGGKAKPVTSEPSY